MDDLHVLTDATGRGWKTSECSLAVGSIVALLLLTPTLGVSLGVAIIVAGYALSRAHVKASTSRALLQDVAPPIKLAAADTAMRPHR